MRRLDPAWLLMRAGAIQVQEGGRGASGHALSQARRGYAIPSAVPAQGGNECRIPGDRASFARSRRARTRARSRAGRGAGRREGCTRCRLRAWRRRDCTQWQLVRHRVPGGDPIAILECALDMLIADRKRTLFGRTAKPRRTNPKISPKPSRYIPRAVRREVAERDGEQCAFVAPDGQRCAERARIELDHHPVPAARNQPLAAVREPATENAERPPSRAAESGAAPTAGAILEPTLATHRPDGAIAPSGSAPTG
jgi:hypothetical protein